MLVKVDLKRNQRQAFLAKLSVKIVNLPAVKQQLALSIWVNVPHATVCVRMQVHAVNPRLAIANEAERVGQLTTTLAQALDLGASKHQATLKGLANLVLMTS